MPTTEPSSSGASFRDLDERVRPTAHTERVPFAIAAWSVPGEPGVLRGGEGGRLRTIRARRHGGPPVGHDLVPLTATVPEAW